MLEPLHALLSSQPWPYLWRPHQGCLVDTPIRRSMAFVLEDLSGGGADVGKLMFENT